MSESACSAAIDSRRWIEYWLNEVDATQAATLEEHLFECSICTVRVQRLAALADSIRSLHREGHLAAIVPAGFVRRMKDAGLSVREYRMGPQGSVNCSVSPQDDFVVGHLEAPLAGVSRLDAILEDVDVESTRRIADIPFNPVDGEVVLLPCMREIRPLARQTLRVRMIAVEPEYERLLGVYTFNHRSESGWS